MHAASRDALAQLDKRIDEILWDAGDSISVAARLGTELFDVVEILDAERPLRVAVAENSSTAEQRAGLIGEVLGNKVDKLTDDLLRHAASLTWSTPKEFRAGLVLAGRRALLRGAEKENQLEQVESELFGLARLLDRQGRLTQLLSDGTQPAAKKRGLLADILYGKVTKYTEALALQVIGRPEDNPIDDISGLADQAAALRGRKVAHVRSAGELSDAQKQLLVDKLKRVFKTDVSIHTEIDESLLGGLVVRVGDEQIDGSTARKIERLRAALA